MQRRKTIFLFDCSSESAAFSIDILMGEIDFVVAEISMFEYRANSLKVAFFQFFELPSIWCVDQNE